MWVRVIDSTAMSTQENTTEFIQIRDGINRIKVDGFT